MTKEEIKKEFIKNHKKINNKRTSKEKRKELIRINKEFLRELEL